MRAGSTVCGACTSGSIARRWGATSPIPGGAAMTSISSADRIAGCCGAAGASEMMRPMSATRGAGEHAFSAVSALLFVVSAAATIVWCRAMANSSSMPAEMPMPGGWTMSMAWMRMPDQTWAGAAASFLGMWIMMMVAMMLPSLVPMLWRYRQAVGGSRRLGSLTAVVGLGYFFV